MGSIIIFLPLSAGWLEVKMGGYRLNDLLDLAIIQKMADAHYRAAGMPIGIIDAIDGSILVGAGWQDICVKFHRADPLCHQRCRESDDYIKDRLVPGEACRYKCKNGLWDIGMPIVVSGSHLATMFLGQFFYEGEIPDREFFTRLAHQFDFVVEEYLDALDRVPVISREKVDYILEYDKALVGFITDLAEQSLAKIKAANEVRQSERKFHAVFDQSHQFLVLLSTDGKVLEANQTALQYWEAGSTEVTGSFFWEALLWENSVGGLQEKVRFATEKAAKGETVGFEIRLRIVDEDLHYLDFSIKPVTDEKGMVVLLVAEGRDITEIRKNEEKVRQQAAFLQLLIDAIPYPVFYKDRQGRYLSCNCAFEQFFGVKREQITGKTVYEMAPKKRAQVYHQADMDLFVNPGTQKYEAVVNAADGKPREVIFHKATFQGRDNAIDGLVGVVVDITDRKRMERSLQDNEARLHALLQTIPDLIWLKDPNGKYLACNAVFGRFFGASEADITGKTDYDFVDKGMADFFRENDCKAIAAGKPRLNEELVTFADDGHEALLETIKTPMFDGGGNLIGVLGVARDITERKRAEEALTARRRELEVLHKISEIALREHSLAQTLQEITREVAAALAFEIVAIDYYNENRQEMELAAETGIPPVESELLRRISADRTPSGQVARLGRPLVEKQGMNRTEKQFDILRSLGVQTVVCVPLFIGTRIIGALTLASPVSVCLDERIVPLAGSLAHLISTIIERKWGEMEKAKLESQLRQAQKMESIGSLAGGVAHDFNNMLGVILGHAELALEQLDSSQPPFANLTQIQNAAKRSVDLTRQLLAFASKQTIAPKILSLDEIVAGMLKMLRRLIGENIDLAWLPDTQGWLVNIDPSQIDQVLVNLCVNARDAISGVGKVTIETNKTTFDKDYCTTHSGFSPGDYVMLAVSDNGHGMNEETRMRIFEPFFTTKQLGKGTGLGLSTVYGIVKQNNGFIHVYSELEHGTTFKIYLPRYQDDVGHVLDDHFEISEVRGHETILLVEDEPAILEMTKTMLEGQGYHVLSALTPGEALKLAEAQAGNIDLLITDVIMPEMNGQELSGKLMSVCPGIRSLFMSGYTGDAIAHHGVLEEGILYIQKPFSRHSLGVKVREALDKE